MEFIVYLALVLTGLCLGSFAGASVWRLRALQLRADKKNKEEYDSKEYNKLKKLLGKGALKDRSRCLHCSYELKWYDLIPVLSWLSLAGKCRSCRKPIGVFELVIELGLAAFFVASYVFWPLELTTGLEVAHFILWLIAGVIMAILFAYDLKWFLLPDKLTASLAVVGVGIVALSAIQSENAVGVLLSALGALGILSGLYAFLFFVSKGRWIGFGDVKLGVGLALLLGSWELSLLALFLANFIGCLIIIPLLATKKLKRDSHVPFGPLLIAGAVIAWFAGWPIINWYLSSMSI